MIYLKEALTILIQFVFGIYLMLVMLRFLLQLVRADFYNPLSQAVVTLTNPPLRILRRFIPGLAGIDWPSIVLLILIQLLEIVLLSTLNSNYIPAPAGLFILTLAYLIQRFLILYIFIIFVMVVISWVNPGAHNPITSLMQQLTRPIMDPVRKLIPPTGGLDFSPMVVLLILFLLFPLIVKPLLHLGSSLS